MSNIKITSLIKGTLSLFSKNGGKILALFVLFSLVNLLFVAGLDYVKLSSSSKVYPAIYNIFALYVNYMIYFAFIKTTNSNIGLHKSFSYIVKKTIPLIITSALGLAIFAGICGLFYSAIILTNSLSDLVKIIAYIVIGAGILVSAIFGIRFFVFSTYIAVLEEKYYFSAMIKSFEYSRDKVWPIFYKNALITLVIFLPFIIIDMAFIKDASMNSSDVETIRAILFYLPQQFLVVVNYLLYKIYKHAPKN